MALSMEDLKRLMTEAGLMFFEAPAHPVLLFMISGKSGNYEFCLESNPEGTIIQFRTFNFLSCHEDHIHSGPVLAMLGELNNDFRVVKLGWDRKSGAITACHAVLLMDGTMTSEQFKMVLHFYMSVVDEMHGKLAHVINTGKAPASGTPGGR